ncbi:MAG TPA: hypothetical protein VGQ85_03860 [Candidatus Limnocylindrales bacterium]|nr:hypothetical protein [Candidatus Limnocylindrales bacterium]
MPDQRVVERIDAWAAAGLIDEATASRLRAAEAEAAVPADGVPMDAHAVGSAPTRSAAASVFGPAVAIGELFAYVGAGFLLAAWHTLFASLFAPESSGAFLTRSLAAQAVQLAVPAIVFGVVGMLVKRRGERERRAAGVAFVVATVHVFGAVGFAMQAVHADLTITLIVASASAVIAAILFRRALGSVLTQLALLGALVGLAISLLGWLSTQLFPQPGFTDFGPQPINQGIAQLRVMATLAWWILWAAGFGLIALLESRRNSDPNSSEGERANAHARANFTRFVAGMTAVLGTLNAVGQGNPFDRVIPVWLGDLALLAVALVLIVIAFRRNATAYLVPAAIGVIGALSDLNATYVADRTGVGVALLLEGVILIGVGFVADRLRRRLWGEQKTGNGAPAAPLTAVSTAVEPVPIETAPFEPAPDEPAPDESRRVEPAEPQ